MFLFFDPALPSSTRDIYGLASLQIANLLERVPDSESGHTENTIEERWSQARRGNDLIVAVDIGQMDRVRDVVVLGPLARAKNHGAHRKLGVLGVEHPGDGIADNGGLGSAFGEGVADP